MTENPAEQAKRNKRAVSSAVRAGGKRHRALAVITAVAVIAAGIFTGSMVYARQTEQARQEKKEMEAVVNVDTFYPGTIVQGVELGGMTMEQARAAMKEKEADTRGEYDVTLTHGSDQWSIQTDDLSFTYNTDDILKQAYNYARAGELKDRYKLVQELKITPKKYAISAVADMNAAAEKVKEIARKVEKSPKDATVRSFNAATEQFAFQEGQNGVRLDEAALVQQVQAILKQDKKGQVEIQTTTAPYKLSAADLSKNMKRLGSYTTVSTNSVNGTHNMRLAFQSLDGTVVGPGDVFSYLDIVGAAGKEDGYMEAGAILNGKLIQSYGGGICQTSTTIYGAALRSNMEIVERYNHSIRSTYCPIGQDAAVSYGALDFKFKNTSNYPVYISAKMSGKKLSATFYGWQSPSYDKIDVTSKLTETVPALTTPKYLVDQTMKTGTMKLDAKAREGYKASAQRVFYKNGKIVKTENLRNSYYRPAPAFYSVGPGTDPKTAKLISGKPDSSSSPASSVLSSSTPSSSAPASSTHSSTPSSGHSSQASPSSSGQSSAPEENPDVETGIIIPG